MIRTKGFWTYIGMLNNSAVQQSCFHLRTVFGRTSWRRIKWMNPRVSHRECYQPTDIEHVANIITHGLWVVPSFLGIFQLLIRSHTPAQTLSAIVYGTTLALLFSVSTCFHCSCYYHQKGLLRNFLHRCDKAIIHLFIAGSYFPWLTLENYSHDSLASMMKWYIWVLAIFGIIYQQVFHERYKSIETAIYLVNGLGPALLIYFQDGITAFSELMFGGFFYIGGLVFFKSDGIIPCAHAIWHVLVTVAAGIQYQAILYYLY